MKVTKLNSDVDEQQDRSPSTNIYSSKVSVIMKTSSASETLCCIWVLC